jgi:hypothetical protein
MPQRKPLSNHEVVTLAVHALGGGSRSVDTEDVAIKANELAPGRFLWRKYPSQINLETVRVYLSDAKKPAKGAYLMGSGSKGWMLTRRGLEFAMARSGELAHTDLSRTPMSQKERAWLRSERARLLADPVTGKFQSVGIDGITSEEAEAVFRVDEYVRGQARQRKIVRLLNSFRDDPELGGTLEALALKVRQG